MYSILLSKATSKFHPIHLAMKRGLRLSDLEIISKVIVENVRKTFQKPKQTDSQKSKSIKTDSLIINLTFVR